MPLGLKNMVEQILNVPEEKKRRVYSVICPRCKLRPRVKTKLGDFRAYCTECFREIYLERKNGLKTLPKNNR